MDLTTAANLIISVGIPAAQKIIEMFSKASLPMQAEWDALKALASTKAKDLMAAQLTAAGIALDSPQGVAMLALAS